MLGTISSGYDSATAAALCRRVGMDEAVSITTGREGAEDHGAEIARILGLELHLYNRNAWRKHALAEVPFVASNSRGGEVFFKAAEPHLTGRVLVTGFHGDKMWGKATTALGPDLVRGDMSGLSLCEYRLIVGFIHLPLPFMGVRDIAKVHALSNSPELREWDVPGDYSRPICRRIVESAGVPRDAFGVTKKLASVHFGQGQVQLSPEASLDYHQWLRDNRSVWAQRKLHAPRPPGRFSRAVLANYQLVERGTRALTKFAPMRTRAWILRAVSRYQRHLTRRVNLHDSLFPWAIARLARLYADRSASDGADASITRR